MSTENERNKENLVNGDVGEDEGQTDRQTEDGEIKEDTNTSQVRNCTIIQCGNEFLTFCSFCRTFLCCSHFCNVLKVKFVLLRFLSNSL